MMKFKPLSLPVPKQVIDVYNQISSLLSPGKKAAIAGGCLSDLYMGIPFRDVDIFLDDDSLSAERLSSVLSAEVRDLSIIDGEGEYATLKYKIYKTTIDGIDYDFVFVQHIDRIYDFDMRFRQFYYLDGACFANKKALEDIQNKKMVLINLYSSYRVLTRIKLFSDRYGFSLEPKSKKYLEWYLNKREFKHDSVSNYIKEGRNKLTEAQRTELIEELSPYKQGENLHFKGAGFPFHPALELGLLNWLKTDPAKSENPGLVGRHYDRITDYAYPLADAEPFSFTLTKEDIDRSILSTIGRCHKIYQKYALKASLNPKLENTVSILEPMFDDNVPKSAKISLFQTSSSYFADFALKMNVQQTLSNRARSLPLAGTEYEVSFQYDTNANRFCDVLSQHTFVVTLKHRDLELNCLFRKCSNGLYTVSDLLMGSTLGGHGWVLVPALISHLMKKYPNTFTFGSESTQALVHKDTVKIKAQEHFFPLEKIVDEFDDFVSLDFAL